MTRAQTRKILGLAIAAGAAFGLSGCKGHGNYTTEGINRAEERMAEMKSGTEWELARQSYLAGDLDKALKKAEISIALNDDVPKSHVLRGRILLEMGRMDGALESFEEALVHDEEFVDAYYYQGIVFERIVKRKQALEHFMKAAELDDGKAQYAIAAAEAMIDLGRIDEAKEFLLSRNEQFQHNPGVRQTLGHISLMTDRNEQAVELFNEARLLAPDDNAIIEDLVRAQVLTERFGEAEYNLSQLLADLEPGQERRDLEHMRARCLVALKRPVEARDLYVSLTEDTAGAADVEAWAGLGKVAFALRDDNRLRLAATRVMALAPQRAEGHTLMSLWHHRRGNSLAALDTISNAIDREPTDVMALTFRSMILEDLGRFDEAKQSLAKALDIEPGNPNALAMLGRLQSGAFATVPVD